MCDKTEEEIDNSLNEFFEQFVKDQKPLDPDFQKILNDNLWDLLQTD